MPGDLHNHSTCSDGSVPIQRLPILAARVGLDTMAISDHDTLLSVQYGYDHPTQDGVRLIPATELTGYDYERQHRVHLLAFWPDPESPALRRHCDLMRQRRNECCLQSAREIEAIYPSSAPNRRWNTPRTAACFTKAALSPGAAGTGAGRQHLRRDLPLPVRLEPAGRRAPLAGIYSSAGSAGHGQGGGAVVVFAHPTVYKSMPLLRSW